MRLAFLLFVMMACLMHFHGVPRADQEGVKLSGKVFFVGAQPDPLLVSVTTDDHVCGTIVRISRVIRDTKNAGLADVVVSVDRRPDDHLENGAPSHLPAVISNIHCAFSPRVKTAQVGQDVEIQNEDPIMHNTHIKLDQRTFVNVAQLPGAQPISKKIKKPGWHLIRCDKHKFMSATLLVFDHPYYAVTDETGSYQLPPLLPGRYTIRVWHETLGTTTREIEVSRTNNQSVDFSFRE